MAACFLILPFEPGCHCCNQSAKIHPSNFGEFLSSLDRAITWNSSRYSFTSPHDFNISNSVCLAGTTSLAHVWAAITDKMIMITNDTREVILGSIASNVCLVELVVPAATIKDVLREFIASPSSSKQRDHHWWQWHGAGCLCSWESISKWSYITLTMGGTMKIGQPQASTCKSCIHASFMFQVDLLDWKWKTWNSFFMWFVKVKTNK